MSPPQFLLLLPGLLQAGERGKPKGGHHPQPWPFVSLAVSTGWAPGLGVAVQGQGDCISHPEDRISHPQECFSHPRGTAQTAQRSRGRPPEPRQSTVSYSRIKMISF